MAGAKNIAVTTASIQAEIKTIHNWDMSRSSIRLILKDAGWSWRARRPIQSYVNMPVNIIKRSKFAKELVMYLE
jgi:transposase